MPQWLCKKIHAEPKEEKHSNEVSHAEQWNSGGPCDGDYDQRHPEQVAKHRHFQVLQVGTAMNNYWVALKIPAAVTATHYWTQSKCLCENGPRQDFFRNEHEAQFFKGFSSQVPTGKKTKRTLCKPESPPLDWASSAPLPPIYPCCFHLRTPLFCLGLQSWKPSTGGKQTATGRSRLKNEYIPQN